MSNLSFSQRDKVEIETTSFAACSNDIFCLILISLNFLPYIKITSMMKRKRNKLTLTIITAFVILGSIDTFEIPKLNVKPGVERMEEKENR